MPAFAVIFVAVVVVVVVVIIIIGRPGLTRVTSVITLATATAEMFPNADDNLSNCVENPSQYN